MEEESLPDRLDLLFKLIVSLPDHGRETDGGRDCLVTSSQSTTKLQTIFFLNSNGCKGMEWLVVVCVVACVKSVKNGNGATSNPNLMRAS
jgi:hypothetical protein